MCAGNLKRATVALPTAIAAVAIRWEHPARRTWQAAAIRQIIVLTRGELCPTFPNLQAGYVGAALMSALRLLQGAALGANSASAAAHLSEHAQHPSQSPCLLASLVPLASALGTLAAAGTCFVAAWCLDGESLGTWGWRLPLVAGLLVNLVAAVPRIAVLRDPQEAMSLAEIEDRHAVNLGRTIRCVSLRRPNHWGGSFRSCVLGTWVTALPASGCED